MRDISTKVDGVDTLPADAFNSDQNELENIVTSADISLDPNVGPDSDLNMLGKSVAAYANAGNIYQDSGVANTYVLSLASNLKHVTKYYDGMMVIFKVGNGNTGASTINVNSLGAKDFTSSAGVAFTSGIIRGNDYVIAVYSLGDDRFELLMQGLGSTILTRVVAIGEWDMDATETVTVPHGGVNNDNIRSIDVIIRRDSDAGDVLHSLFNYRVPGATTSANGGVDSIGGVNIALNRLTGGAFDTTDFDEVAGYNRGWIYIKYEI